MAELYQVDTDINKVGSGGTIKGEIDTNQVSIVAEQQKAEMGINQVGRAI